MADSVPPPRPSPAVPELADVKTDPGSRRNPLVMQAAHMADKAARRRSRRAVAWSTVAMTTLTLLGPDIRDALRAVVALIWHSIGGAK